MTLEASIEARQLVKFNQAITIVVEDRGEAFAPGAFTNEAKAILRAAEGRQGRTGHAP